MALGATSLTLAQIGTTPCVVVVVVVVFVDVLVSAGGLRSPVTVGAL